MEIFLEIILILFLILINAFFSCAEIAIISTNKAIVKSKIENNDKNAVKLMELIKAPSKMLSTIQVAITLSSFFASASAAVTISSKITFLSPRISIILVTIILSYITLVLGELVPKRIGLENATNISLKIVNIIDIISKIFTPIIYILSISTNFILFIFRLNKKSDDDNISKEEMISILNTCKLRDMDKEILENIIEFDEKLAREIMIPRPSIFAVSIDNSIKDLLKIEKITRYSRIPVFENDLDNIKGILHIKDLLVIEDKNLKVSEFMKEAYFVPDTKKNNELFFEMKNNNIHIAVLIDEYGGVSGIVTLEDLLEEIVGNITDEYDNKIYDIVEISKNKYLLNGELSINDLNDYFDTKFESEYYDTIAGLIIEKTGFIPNDNEKINDLEIDNCIFRIQKVKNKKILKVLFIKKEEENNVQTNSN